MVEYRFDPNNGKLLSKEVTNDTINVEFSAVQNMGEFNQYGYTAIQDPSTPGEGSFVGICFWVMSDRTFQTVYYDEHEVGGEPLVAQDETDGTVYVGTYAYHQKTEDSSFVLYHGATTALVCRIDSHASPGPDGLISRKMAFLGRTLRGHFERQGQEFEEYTRLLASNSLQ